MKKIIIKSYEVADDIFDKILYDFAYDIQIVPSTEPYIHGYKNKETIYYDGKEYMIIREYIVNYYCNDKIENCTEWKQCRIRRTENTSINLNRTTDGTTAWNYIMRELNKYYTDEEIKKIFKEHEANYDESLIQQHYLCPIDGPVIRKFTNCYYYDINGAHTDALLELFPKAKKSILKFYTLRKENPIYKSYTNYFVGMLQKKGYSKTYNWVVQRTTKMLLKALDYVQGLSLYINTDGFIVANPKNLLEASSKLGEFKCEYQGDVYIYYGKNYSLLQAGNTQKGSCLKAVRSQIDLSKGKVVEYTRKRLKVVQNASGESIYINTAENVKEIKVDVKNGN